MAKAEWGLKRICHSCGTRYYDMRRAPIVCPKCGTEFDPEALLKSRRGRPSVVAGGPAAVELGGVTAGEEDAPIGDEAEKADEEEELIEDTSELGEDEDDVAEVIENVDEDEER
ncbi:MAG: TIGR02300 family protein [Alphaproteobacteria bacterium]|nr:TIGR02300 family protein [Alphaproteobacteria bacterium]